MIPDMASAPDGVDVSAWRAAQAAIRGYCGWHVAPSVTQSLTLDGPGSTLLRLPSMHVTDVTSVVNDGREITDPQWSASGMIRGRWTEKFRGVTVTLMHGYDPCPPDVLDVLTQMATYAQLLASSGAGGIASQMASGPHSFSVSTAAAAGSVGLSGQHRGVLNRYRLSSSP